MEKKKITIEVEPIIAVSTIGLLRGLFPSIIELLEQQATANDGSLIFKNIGDM